MNRFAGLCLLTVAAASLAMTGCGSVSGTTTTARTGRPSGTATATAGGLCAAVSKVDSVTVRRGGAGPANHSRSHFPRQIVVSRPRQVRAVARAVCALPRMPGGIFACPADFGTSYRLEFAVAGRRLAVVTVDPGGCQRVAGAGPARWAERSPGFWRVLSRAAVVPGPAAGLGGCGGAGRLMCAQGAP
jgi:hypothetical protein